MAEHVLKTWPNAWDAIADGRKRFEYRHDDRGFEVGDILSLRRWDPQARMSVNVCRELRVRVTYILRGAFGVPPDYVVMSIEREDGDG